MGSAELVQRVGLSTDIAGLRERPVTILIDRGTGRPWPWIFTGASAVHAGIRHRRFRYGVLCRAERPGLRPVAGYHVFEHIHAGRLIPALPTLALSPWPLSVYRPQRKPVPAREQYSTRWRMHWAIWHMFRSHPSGLGRRRPARGKSREMRTSRERKTEKRRRVPKARERREIQYIFLRSVWLRRRLRNRATAAAFLRLRSVVGFS